MYDKVQHELNSFREEVFTKPPQEIYEKDVGNEEEIYASYFAEENEIIPIYTAEQLLNVGTNEYIVSGDKIYKFSTNGNYKLMSSFSLDVNTHISEYPEIFQEVDGVKEWIGIQEQLPNGTFDFNLNKIIEKDTSSNKKTHEGIVYTFAYAEDSQTFIAPASGIYKLEVWGAQGGTYNKLYATGGVGGYSVGNINLKQDEELYVYVGTAGTYGTSSTVTTVSGGGYNGGGNAAYRGGAGGGATDIRIDGNTLYNRVIVAGGGGGAYSYSTTIKANGGNGGGTTGESGSYYKSVGSTYIGGGATATGGGTRGNSNSANYYGNEGDFGVGADTGRAYKVLTTTYNSSGAGRRRLVWRRQCWKLCWFFKRLCCRRRWRLWICVDKFCNSTRGIFSIRVILFNWCWNI